MRIWCTILVFLMIIGCQKQPTQHDSDKFIKILKPNGGEVHSVGDTLEISWNADGINLFTIHISYNSGINYTEIASNYYSEEYRFKFKPDHSSDSCIIKIEDTNNPNIFDVSDSLFSIKPVKFIQILKPNGGEKFNLVDSLEVTWNAGAVNSINIYMSYNGGINYNEIANNYHSGEYRFKFKPERSSDSCIIRIEDAENPNLFDVSDSLFSIRTARSIEILKPNGGEIYIVDDSLELSWKAVGINSFNIYMSYNGGINYSEIIHNYYSEEFRFKFKPQQYSDKCIVKIEDAGDNNIFDISNAYFSIGVEFFPLDNIRSWTYRYSEHLTIAMRSVFHISGTKNWEYISKTQNLDSTLYLFKEVFNYQRIDNPYYPPSIDTTYHIDTTYFSIIDYKTSQDSIKFVPPFYTSIQSYYIQYNLPLHRYYVTTSDTIHSEVCCPSYVITLEKGVGIKYLDLYGVEGGHSSNSKTWELINYQLK
jgi:hypothetical protein